MKPYIDNSNSLHIYAQRYLKWAFADKYRHEHFAGYKDQYSLTFDPFTKWLIHVCSVQISVHVHVMYMYVICSMYKHFYP